MEINLTKDAVSHFCFDTIDDVQQLELGDRSVWRDKADMPVRNPTNSSSKHY
jgi:hypothetical protein